MEEEQSYTEWLLSKGQLKERPFESNVPLIGPLIAGFRSLWNSMAAKWVVRSLIQQQSDFNALMVQQMDDFEHQIYGQVIEQDKEQTFLVRETTELSMSLGHIYRMLEVLDERLAHLEENRRSSLAASADVTDEEE